MSHRQIAELDSQFVLARGQKHPLTISPNLEALLEHDERTRPRAIGFGPLRQDILIAAASLSSNTAPFIGLPPPPRGPRKMTAKVGEKAADVEDSPRSASSSSPELELSSRRTSSGDVGSTSNPYINPAPSLESLLKAEAITPPPMISSFPSSNSTTQAPVDKIVTEPTHLKTKDTQNDPRTYYTTPSSDGRKKRSKRPDPQKQRTGLSHQDIYPPPLSRIQVKRIFSDYSANMENSRSTTMSDEYSNYSHADRTPMTLRDRARNRARATRWKGISTPCMRHRLQLLLVA